MDKRLKSDAQERDALNAEIDLFVSDAYGLTASERRALGRKDIPNEMWLSEKDVVGRGARISKLLRPISFKEAGPAWSRLARGGTQIIIGTHDEARPSSDYRDWRFSINARGFVAMYFELWTLESRDRFILEKAYLNLYRWNGSSEKEIVCLHCDPSLPETRIMQSTSGALTFTWRLRGTLMIASISRSKGPTSRRS